MKSFNSVTLMGNLTKDPELRTTPNGQSVTSFSLALNRSYKAGEEWKEATDYVDVVVWAKLAETVAQFCKKGNQVLVSGRLQTSSWEQDGQKRSKLEVIANDVVFTKTEKPKDVVADVPDSEIDLDSIAF